MRRSSGSIVNDESFQVGHSRGVHSKHKVYGEEDERDIIACRPWLVDVEGGPN